MPTTRVAGADQAPLVPGFGDANTFLSLPNGAIYGAHMRAPHVPGLLEYARIVPERGLTEFLQRWEEVTPPAPPATVASWGFLME